MFERLIEVFKSVFGDDINLEGVNEGSALVEDLGMNSIGMLYMAMALEEEFSVKFSNEDFTEIKTVEDIIKIIEKRQ